MKELKDIIKTGDMGDIGRNEIIDHMQLVLKSKPKSEISDCTKSLVTEEIVNKTIKITKVPILIFFALLSGGTIFGAFTVKGIFDEAEKAKQNITTEGNRLEKILNDSLTKYEEAFKRTVKNKADIAKQNLDFQELSEKGKLVLHRDSLDSVMSKDIQDSLGLIKKRIQIIQDTISYDSIENQKKLDNAFKSASESIVNRKKNNIR